MTFSHPITVQNQLIAPAHENSYCATHVYYVAKFDDSGGATAYRDLLYQACRPELVGGKVVDVRNREYFKSTRDEINVATFYVSDNHNIQFCKKM